MKRRLPGLFIFLMCLCFVFSGCSRGEEKNTAGKRRVHIGSQNGKYVVYRDGRPFFIKGASGFTNLKALQQTGGNTIRTWDTLHLKQVLDSAEHYKLGVVVGLPMPASEDMDFYNDDLKAGKCIKEISLIVNRFKDHPAVLFWCLGNELVFPNRPKYLNFYKTFNKITSIIHETDPDHPVTTTLLSVQPKMVFNITYRTKIDFLSFNVFGGIKTFSKDIADLEWFWKGPFLITEWGIEGPWTSDQQNAWGSYVENTSSKKAEQYLEIYQKYMPVSDTRFLGSMVFYWGQKQEFTPTWFSFFDELGRKTEVVNVLHYLWTGQQVQLHAPQINYTLLNGKGGRDNIFLKPGAIAGGEVFLAQADSSDLSYRWELLKEDWHKPNGIFSEKKPERLEGLILENGQPKVKFKVPEQEGPYRLFLYMYNQHGYFATANTPFYVIGEP